MTLAEHRKWRGGGKKPLKMGVYSESTVGWITEGLWRQACGAGCRIRREACLPEHLPRDWWWFRHPSAVFDFTVCLLSLTSLFVFAAGNQRHVLKESIQINAVRYVFVWPRFTEEPSRTLQLLSAVSQTTHQSSLRQRRRTFSCFFLFYVLYIEWHVLF